MRTTELGRQILAAAVEWKRLIKVNRENVPTLHKSLIAQPNFVDHGFPNLAVFHSNTTSHPLEKENLSR
jgi:hypothetical protein